MAAGMPRRCDGGPRRLDMRARGLHRDVRGGSAGAFDVTVSARHPWRLARAKRQRRQLRRGERLRIRRARARGVRGSGPSDDREGLLNARRGRERAAIAGPAMRSDGRPRRSRLCLLPASLGVSAVLAAGLSAQVPGDLASTLARVGDRVRQYYSRAQSIMCIERVTVQPLRSDLGPDGFGRVLEYELRIDWDAADDVDGPPEARVVRELRKVNGRPPRPNDNEGCLDPKSG